MFIEENIDKCYVKTVSEFDTIVISGGSIKGIAALGSLQYLYDNFLCEKITNYVGTSVGSIICYLLAIGYTPIEIIVYICTNHLIEKINSFNIVNMFNGTGATSYTVINEHLEKMTIDKIGRLITLGELKRQFNKNLVCATHNMTHNKTEYLDAENYSELPCLVAIRMSSNIPLLFEPFKYTGMYYLDGGLSDNFPLVKAQELGKKVIGIVIYGQEPIDNPTDKMTEYFFGLLSIMICRLTTYQIEKKNESSIIVNLHTGVSHSFEFSINASNKLDLFSYGYQTMKDNII